MPAVSEAQRRLMFAAAAQKGGAGGVPQSVGKDFANADEGGKLPEKVKGSETMDGPERAARRKKVYSHARSKAARGDKD